MSIVLSCSSTSINEWIETFLRTPSQFDWIPFSILSLSLSGEGRDPEGHGGVGHCVGSRRGLCSPPLSTPKTPFLLFFFSRIACSFPFKICGLLIITLYLFDRQMANIYFFGPSLLSIETWLRLSRSMKTPKRILIQWHCSLVISLDNWRT